MQDTSFPRHGRSRRNHRIWLTSARCDVTTPLGRPVEPEVNTMYAGASAATSASG